MSKHPKLIDFFTSLQDAEKLKKFRSDPDAAMDEAGLSAEEKALVKRGDEQEIRTLLGGRGAEPILPPLAPTGGSDS